MRSGKHRTWSSGEIELLTSLWGKVSDEELVAKIGRTRRAIKERAYRLGLYTRTTRVNKDLLPNGLKYCPRCDRTISVSRFGLCSTKGDGLQSYCKDCRNKQEVGLRDQRREYKRLWARENYSPERSRRMAHRRRAAEYEPYTIQQIFDTYGHKCYLCGMMVGDTYHIDHVVPLSRGGSDTIENVRKTHPFCNMSKSDRMVDELTEEFFEECRRVHVENSRIERVRG